MSCRIKESYCAVTVQTADRVLNTLLNNLCKENHRTMETSTVIDSFQEHIVQARTSTIVDIKGYISHCFGNAGRKKRCKEHGLIRLQALLT